MPAFTASAPGKIILFGEHAVVYQQPAIAAPVTQVRAKAVVMPDVRGQPGRGQIIAPDLGVNADLRDLPGDHGLAAAVTDLLAHLGIGRAPAFTLKITSTIPFAAGLGSGAAVSVAILRAMSAFLGQPLPDEQINALTYEVEKIYHGTPSGIDNTVVTYAAPVYFVRGQPITRLRVARPFTLVIADTGVSSPTSVTVGDVRTGWQADPARYEEMFAAVGQIGQQARAAIENGNPAALGPLMDDNHYWLREMGVSCSELERLVLAARNAGALGAKLSGGGRGGNMIALVEPHAAPRVVYALEAAGAVRTIVTEVK